MNAEISEPAGAQESPRLWIHIGLPKTGTSAVQEVLSRSRSALRVAGFDYPLTGEVGGGHARLAWPFLSASRQQGADVLDGLSRDDGIRLWGELGNETVSRGCHDIVLSSEYFSEVDDLDLLAELCGRVSQQVKVLVYLRRQDELVESGYNQVVKAGLSAERFSVGPYTEHYDYQLTLRAWEAAFGEGRIIPRVYDSSVARQGVVYDLAEQVGIEPVLLGRAEGRANLGLSPHLVEFKRLANALGMPTSELVDHLSQRMDVIGSPAASGLLTLGEREQVLSTYAESNAAVARDYFGRDQLFAPPVQGSAVERTVSNELLACASLLLWQRVDEHVAELRHELATLKAMGLSSGPR